MSNSPKAPYGLPEEVVFCKRCVISNQRPSTVAEFKHKESDKKPTSFIDENGLCNACRWADKKAKFDWADRERQLRDLLDRYRRDDGRYDCIIPGSGGKDSAFVSHMLKYKYGMNPLTVTWAPHLYTDIGFRNFSSWINSGLDNILVTPNGKVHRLLTRMAFLNLLHPFQPFILGQKTIAPRISLQYDVPLIMYGENPVEYGNNLEEGEFPTMFRRYYSTPEENMSNIALGGVPAEELFAQGKISKKDLHFYLPIAEEKFEKAGTEVHYFSYYHNWDPQENFYYATEHTGFELNTERTQGSYSKYSSIDDKIDPYHYYTTLIKFGLGRATYDAAQEIRCGKISREEGVELVRKFDEEFPSRFFKEFLGYIDITEQQFWDTIDKFRTPHLWHQVDGKWKLRKQVS